MKSNSVLKANYLRHIWLEDIGLSIMLSFVIVVNFILQPLYNGLFAIRIINEGLILVVTISGIWSLLDGTKTKIMSTIVPIAYLLVTVLDYYSDQFTYHYIKLFLIAGIFSILINLILKKVFDSRPVNNYKIIGALLVFLLAANFFSVIYDTLQKSLPNAFLFNSPEDLSTNTHNTFLYFSYTTITTTGFGDIVPKHPIAKSIVVLEQLFGIFYPILLIGRLVSLNVSGIHKHKD